MKKLSEFTITQKVFLIFLVDLYIRTERTTAILAKCLILGICTMMGTKEKILKTKNEQIYF